MLLNKTVIFIGRSTAETKEYSEENYAGFYSGIVEGDKPPPSARDAPDGTEERNDDESGLRNMIGDRVVSAMPEVTSMQPCWK